MDNKREALLRAVSRLVEDPDAVRLFDSLSTIARLARVHPVRMTGDAEDLNPLLDLSLEDPTAYERVLALIESKRARLGHGALVPPKETGFDKADYMRQFMDQKRQRQRRAAAIENMLRPERDKLVGRARLDFMDIRAAEWKSELDVLLARARESLGQRLPREHLDAVRSQFWASIDKRLDDLEQGVRDRMRRK